jgi:hypothetical protein
MPWLLFKKQCRYCSAQSGYGPHRAEQGPPQQGQRMAPYLSVLPRCPLMPPPPEGAWPKARRPPIVWRQQGTAMRPEGQSNGKNRPWRPYGQKYVGGAHAPMAPAKGARNGKANAPTYGWMPEADLWTESLCGRGAKTPSDQRREWL